VWDLRTFWVFLIREISDADGKMFAKREKEEK
jgi:hypothetical protein